MTINQNEYKITVVFNHIDEDELVYTEVRTCPAAAELKLPFFMEKEQLFSIMDTALTNLPNGFNIC